LFIFRRLKEKYDAEIKDLELSEKVTKSKYNETKDKLVEKDDEVIILKANARQLRKELEEAKKVCVMMLQLGHSKTLWKLKVLQKQKQFLKSDIEHNCWIDRFKSKCSV
jgi:bifunctional ADP-heptose synthase (sugar kinase/adenylyltransferase)